MNLNHPAQAHASAAAPWPSLATGLSFQPTSIKAKVFVLDSFPLLRRGLIELINRQHDLLCCGEAGGINEAWKALPVSRPELLILDLCVRDGDGLQFIKSVKELFPGLRILVLSQQHGPLEVGRALTAGALGYVAKDQDAEVILAAMRAVLREQVFLRRGTAARLLRQPAAIGADWVSSENHLTARELHILELIGDGMSSREVAEELKLSLKTIEAHRENLKRKLGLTGAPELREFAARWAEEPVQFPSGSLDESQLEVIA